MSTPASINCVEMTQHGLMFQQSLLDVVLQRRLRQPEHFKSMGWTHGR